MAQSQFPVLKPRITSKVWGDFGYTKDNDHLLSVKGHKEGNWLGRGVER